MTNFIKILIEKLENPEVSEDKKELVRELLQYQIKIEENLIEEIKLALKNSIH